MNTKVMFSSKDSEWSTPDSLYRHYDDLYHFTCDLAASPENTKCSKFFTKDNSALLYDWNGEIFWCNPPYGRYVGSWVKKAKLSVDSFGSTIVMLLPARTDTVWFHEYIYRRFRIDFLKGRLKFSGMKCGAPFPSMVVHFTDRNLYEVPGYELI